MKYSRNAIYNYIANKVGDTVYCSSIAEPIPSSIPACYITEIGHPERLMYADLQRSDEQNDVTFEVQVYSNKAVGKQDEAYSIMRTVEAGFKHLGFLENFCEPIRNADDSIFRLTARFNRLICGGDEMPTD